MQANYVGRGLSQDQLESAAGGMTLGEIGSAVYGTNGYGDAMCRKMLFEKPVRVVVMGASIMDGAFNNEPRKQNFIDQMESAGIAVRDVAEYATGGDDSAAIALVVPTVISDYAGQEDLTLVVLHGGGNDMSASGPYPGGATTLDTNYRQILTDLTSAGFAVFSSTVTYRIPPGSNPSAPYNQQIIIPAITELTPEALRLSGRPLIDLYQWTMATDGIHSPDGIHFTNDGYLAMASYIGSALSDGLDSDAVVTEVNDLIIDFGQQYQSYLFGLVNVGAVTEETYGPFFDSNGKRVDGLSVTVNGFSNGQNGAGKQYNDTGYSLSNNAISRDSLYVAHPAFGGYNGETGVVAFVGSAIESTATYDIEIISSRNTDDTTDDTRWATFTVAGTSIDVDGADLNAVTPNTAVLSGVSGADLIADGIEVRRRDVGLESFAYINGIRITKTS